MSDQGIVILGFDPGFGNVGAFVLRANKLSVRALHAEFIGTKPASKKHRAHELDDEDRRLLILDAAIKSLITTWKPDVVASEYRVRMRNPKTCAQCAMMYASAHLRAKDAGLPFVTYAPEDIKERMTGKRSASKTEVTKALKERFPTFKGWPKGKACEHVADAGGAAICAIDHDLVQALLRERSR